MEKGYVLVLDCGTQSVRGIVYDQKGDLLCLEKTKYPKYETNCEGFCEMHPDIFWDSAVDAVNKMWDSKPEIMLKLKLSH